MWTGKTVKRPRHQPAQPQYANYWAPLTRKTAHHATSSTAPGMPSTGLRERGNDTGRSTGRSGRQNAATQRNTRRDDRGTVQGPVKKQHNPTECHTGGGGGAVQCVIDSWVRVPALGGGYFVPLHGTRFCLLSGLPTGIFAPHF